MLTGTCLKYTAPNAQQARDLRGTRIPRCARGGQKKGHKMEGWITTGLPQTSAGGCKDTVITPFNPPLGSLVCMAPSRRDCRCWGLGIRASKTCWGSRLEMTLHARILFLYADPGDSINLHQLFLVVIAQLHITGPGTDSRLADRRSFDSCLKHGLRTLELTVRDGTASHAEKRSVVRRCILGSVLRVRQARCQLCLASRVPGLGTMHACVSQTVSGAASRWDSLQMIGSTIQLGRGIQCNLGNGMLHSARIVQVPRSLQFVPHAHISAPTAGWGRPAKAWAPMAALTWVAPAPP